jgi:hypothetical protein
MRIFGHARSSGASAHVHYGVGRIGGSRTHIRRDASAHSGVRTASVTAQSNSPPHWAQKCSPPDTREQHSLIESLGAVPIDCAAAAVADYVARHTEGHGFDVVFDTVGGRVLDDYRFTCRVSASDPLESLA